MTQPVLKIINPFVKNMLFKLNEIDKIISVNNLDR
jgi:hypothetical protein